MNIGYFFWGHLTDKLGETSKNTPDGNAWYSSSIIHEFTKQNHKVYGMSIDRDKEDILNFGIKKCFSSFETKKRIYAYNNLDWVIWDKKFTFCNFPKLDILLLEWRFPILGRNKEEDYEILQWQPDLRIQNILLNHYKNTNTKIIIFDLDYKITKKEEKILFNNLKDNVVIIETSIKPKKGKIKRIPVQIPFWIKKGKIKKCKKIDKNKKLVYIGSNYERENSINKYIIPFSNKYPFTTWFYGNWRNYKGTIEKIYCKLKWRDIQYHNRVGHSDFFNIYNDSIACPLLAKQEYYQNGFMTARIQECLYFGSIPIGIAEHTKIEKYLPKELIINDYEDLDKIIENISLMSIKQKNKYRKKLWENLNFMDVSLFVKTLLEVVNNE